MVAISRAEKDMIAIPVEEYEGMMETLEILSNPETAKRILKSIEEVKEGETISENEFAEKFDL